MNNENYTDLFSENLYQDILELEKLKIKKNFEFKKLFGNNDKKVIFNLVSECLNHNKDIKYSFAYINAKLQDLIMYKNSYSLFILHSINHLDFHPNVSRISSAEFKNHFLTDTILHFNNFPKDKPDLNIFLFCLENRLSFLQKNFYNFSHFTDLLDNLEKSIKKAPKSNISTQFRIIWRTIYYSFWVILTYLNPFQPVRKSIYQIYDFVFEGIFYDSKLLILTFREYLSLIFILELFLKINTFQIDNSLITKIRNILHDLRSEIGQIQASLKFSNLFNFSLRFNNYQNNHLFDELLGEFYLSLNENPKNEFNYNSEQRQILQRQITKFFGKDFLAIIQTKNREKWNNLINF